jgi:flagellar basal-body rod protein FlgB
MLDFLNFYGGVLAVRQQRESLVANNIANADTPNYKAVDVAFNAALGAALAPASGPQAGPSAAAPLYRADATVGLNGNDVSLDQERVEAAQNGEALLGAATFMRQATADLVTALRPNPSGN